jgi:hypothetical protein
VLRDIACSFSGDTKYSANLSQFTAPVLVFEAGHALGPYIADTLSRLGSTDRNIIFNAEYGHSDLHSIKDHERYLERPMLRWLDSKVFH